MVVSYTVITAPCDGYVGRKDIHVGQLVQPGQLMVKIVDDANVWIIADYRETQVQHIALRFQRMPCLMLNLPDTWSLSAER